MSLIVRNQSLAVGMSQLPFRKSLVAEALNLVKSRWFWKGNGASYATIPAAYLGSGSTIELTALLSQRSGNLLSFDNYNTDGIYLDTINDKVRAFCYVNWVLSGAPAEVAATYGSVVNIKVTIGANLVATLDVDGVTATTNLAILNGEQGISQISFRPPNNYGTHTIYNLKLTGITNTDVYPSGEAFFALDEYGPDTNYIVSDSKNADGDELIVNGDFSDEHIEWNTNGTSSLSIVDGAMRISRNVGTFSDQCYQDIPTIPGATYIFSGSLVSQEALTSIVINETEYTAWSGTDIVFAATSSTTRLSINPAGNLYAASIVDNISIKQTTKGQIINATADDYIKTIKEFLE